jgi:hypothetical protein
MDRYSDIGGLSVCLPHYRMDRYSDIGGLSVCLPHYRMDRYNDIGGLSVTSFRSNVASGRIKLANDVFVLLADKSSGFF